jgi:hypothetical protein
MVSNQQINNNKQQIKHNNYKKNHNNNKDYKGVSDHMCHLSMLFVCWCIFVYVVMVVVGGGLCIVMLFYR